MTDVNLKDRIEKLSSSKKSLLALRLGLSQDISSEQVVNTQLSAFVVTKSAIETATLRQQVKQSLPQYMIPATFTILDELPRTPNGKVDQNALLNLLEPLEAEQPEQRDTDAPSEIEGQLVNLWQELLDMDLIHVDDDFFELGGYSLLAIRMLAQIKQQFDVDLPPSVIMEAPTIRDLAKRLTTDDKTISNQAIFSLQPDGDLKPLYCFQVHKFGVITYRYVAQYIDSNRPLYGLAMPQDADEIPDTVEGLASVFVENLLHHQSEGPYFLCGMSIAGILAYEAARQLRQRGIDDVHVILFDTYGPTYPKMIPTAQAVQEKMKLHLGSLLSSDVDTAWYLQELLWRTSYRANQRFDKVRNLARRKIRQIMSPEAQDSTNTVEEVIPDRPVREFAGQKVYGEMLDLLELEERYYEQAKPYAGDVILYRSTVQPLRAQYTETLGWDNIVEGQVHVKHMRGTHSGILRYPFVEALVKQLNYELRQLESNSS